MPKPQSYPFSKEEIEVHLEYDKENGCFYRKQLHQKMPAGSIVGCKKANGYIYVGLFKKHIFCHRLVWFFEHGEWPTKVIDHIDGDKTNNKITNLRLATYSQSSMHRKVMSNSKSQLKGVIFIKRKNRYRATIRCNNKRIYLGYYKTAEEAHVAYVAKAKELHKEFMKAA